jgi:hypothetical protein
MASEDFDVMFITPRQLISARATGATGPAGPLQLLSDFSNWTEYVDGTPSVLFIRVTPKFAEGFWTKVARGVAMTQGVSIPSLKRPKGDFARMRALCGETEIVPVHPLKLEHRISEKDTLIEGLYAFDPSALAPACASITLQLFSVNAREPDRLIVDPKVLQQVRQDFGVR